MADLRTVNELIAGSVGGAAQVLVGQPLDTIKTRTQIAPRECQSNFVSRGGIDCMRLYIIGDMFVRLLIPSCDEELIGERRKVLWTCLSKQ